jgi:transposase-like protein
VLVLLDGKGINETAPAIGVRRETVRLWRDRFNERDPDGLKKNRPRRVPKSLPAKKVGEIIGRPGRWRRPTE